MWAFTGLSDTAKDVKVEYQSKAKWYKGLTKHSVGIMFIDEYPTSDFNQLLGQASSPSAPATDVGRVYFKTDGRLYYQYGASGEKRIREMLTANRTYYVRSDGVDTNTGLVDSAGGALRLWQTAVTLVAELDFNGKTVTIQHGNEAGLVTFGAHVTVPTLTGGGLLVISGKDAVGNTAFQTGASNAWTLTNTVTPVQFTNCKLSSAGDTGTIQPTELTKLAIGPGVIFGTCSNAHIWVHDRQAMVYLLSANYTIAGGGNYHIFVNGGMVFHEACAVTMSGAPAFVTFINAINGGAVQSPNNSTFTGATTGQRYSATMGGIINTSGGGANYFPGNAAGATATGGQYG